MRSSNPLRMTLIALYLLCAISVVGASHAFGRYYYAIKVSLPIIPELAPLPMNVRMRPFESLIQGSSNPHAIEGILRYDFEEATKLHDLWFRAVQTQSHVMLLQLVGWLAMLVTSFVALFTLERARRAP
jgi:hypothetical protein